MSDAPQGVPDLAAMVLQIAPNWRGARIVDRDVGEVEVKEVQLLVEAREHTTLWYAVIASGAEQDSVTNKLKQLQQLQTQFRWTAAGKKINLLKECLDKKPYKKGHELDPATKKDKVVHILEKWKHIDSVIYKGVMARGCKDAVVDILKKIKEDNKDTLLKSGTDKEFTKLEKLANDYAEEVSNPLRVYEVVLSMPRLSQCFVTNSTGTMTSRKKRTEDDIKVKQLMVEVEQWLVDCKRHQLQSASVDPDNDDAASHSSYLSAKEPWSSAPTEKLAHVVEAIAKTARESLEERQKAREVKEKLERERWELERGDRRESMELEREQLRLKREEQEQHQHEYDDRVRCECKDKEENCCKEERHEKLEFKRNMALIEALKSLSKRDT
ncbi:hypothetical protein M427DRAFT_504170 [Gonapodya prolifera JEL478]|uniref:Uncharacterized protein n=1 Tax=Gonapodya prolifera (strain JEL478) TaxID=1344416 RepID=A0A139A4G5_GONPJ|nr:hypothetical protein M427DRAFT_504170 [Gonapodya prolifera JEL478]|eukprot:KXS11717.1 hypothetical protein M427DRAFT_504170 [Gonapodya prolifera JEL478]